MQPPAPTLLPPSAASEIYHPALHWWLERTAALGRLPTRSELEPRDLGAAALPHVILVDIIGQAEDLRFRLVGTAHARFNQRDLTGELFSAVYPAGSPTLDYIKGLYLEMIETRRPIWSLNEFMPPTRDLPIRMGRLMLPLSTRGADVDLCAAVQLVSTKTRSVEMREDWRGSPYHGERERQIL